MEVYHQSLLWHAFALSRPMRHFDRILDAQIRSRDEARRWIGRVWTRPDYSDRLPGGWDPSQTGRWSSHRAPVRCGRPLASVTHVCQRSWVSANAQKGQRSFDQSSDDMEGDESPSPVPRQDDSSVPGKSLAGRLLGKAIKLFIKTQLESCGVLAVSVAGGNSELLAGQVRELQISARDVVYKGIAISEVYLSASSIRLNLGWQDAGRLLSEPFAIMAAAQMNQTDLNASLASPTLSSVISDLLGHRGGHPSGTVSTPPPPLKSNNSSPSPANKILRSEKETSAMPNSTRNVSDNSHMLTSAPSSMPFRATLADGTVVLRPLLGSLPHCTQSSRRGGANKSRRSHSICGDAQAQAQAQAQARAQEGVAAAASVSQPAAAILSFHVGNDGQQLSVKVEPFEEGPPAAASHPPVAAHHSMMATSAASNLENIGRRQNETGYVPHLEGGQVNRNERHFSLGPCSRINELTVTSDGIRLLGDFIVMPTPLEH